MLYLKQNQDTQVVTQHDVFKIHLDRFLQRRM